MSNDEVKTEDGKPTLRHSTFSVRHSSFLGIAEPASSAHAGIGSTPSSAARFEARRLHGGIVTQAARRRVFGQSFRGVVGRIHSRAPLQVLRGASELVLLVQK